MDNPHTIDRIMAGDIPPLEEVTPKQLSALVTLLQTFHLGRAMGQNNTPKEAEYDLFQQLVLLKDTLSDKTRRTSVRDALVASWPKAKKVSTTPLNNLSIVSTNPESTST
ncbi:MAG: hypothetical protein ISR46_03665 [Rhodospirillales bacterium]|nr:hypothetical protein [Rhodospirillales bacterium]